MVVIYYNIYPTYKELFKVWKMQHSLFVANRKINFP